MRIPGILGEKTMVFDKKKTLEFRSFFIIKVVHKVINVKT